MECDGIEVDGDVLRAAAGGSFDGPLDVVRAARDSARLDLDVDDETVDRMAERADRFDDVEPALLGQHLLEMFGEASSPRRFFDVLSAADVLDGAYPEVAALDGLPAGPEGTHEEGDSLEHALLVVEEMQGLRPNDVNALLAALAHDLGKGETAEETLPSHYGHAKRGVDVSDEMCDRLGLSDAQRMAMRVGARQHMRLHTVRDLNATTVLDMAKQVADSPLTAGQVADVGKADSLGREPTRPYYGDEVREKLEAALEVIDEVGAEEALANRGMTPDEISEEKLSNLVRQDRAEEFRARL